MLWGIQYQTKTKPLSTMLVFQIQSPGNFKFQSYLWLKIDLFNYISSNMHLASFNIKSVDLLHFYSPISGMDVLWRVSVV